MDNLRRWRGIKCFGEGTGGSFLVVEALQGNTWEIQQENNLSLFKRTS